ncbi:MAG: type IV pilus modification protein PilV [Comamonadaceae bacterium]|nr:MAG: type IV pilus modification protein PilV [Comamonadaceae bacterium]
MESQRGITLLESLVALVITAVAILGVIGVQVRSLADTQTAVRRAQAVRLIDDLSERLKVNPNALAVLGDYAHGWGGPTVTPPSCTSGCTAADLAKHDIAGWWNAVETTLPLGDAATFLVANETDANGRRQLGVMLSWRESERRGKDDSDAQYETYRKPFASASTGSAAVECPAGRICHLQYIQPTARCTVGLLSGPTGQTLHCPIPLMP